MMSFPTISSSDYLLLVLFVSPFQDYFPSVLDNEVRPIYLLSCLNSVTLSRSSWLGIQFHDHSFFGLSLILSQNVYICCAFFQKVVSPTSSYKELHFAICLSSNSFSNHLQCRSHFLFSTATMSSPTFTVFGLLSVIYNYFM